jgi:hypothetical protein
MQVVVGTFLNVVCCGRSKFAFGFAPGFVRWFSQAVLNGERATANGK